MKTYARALIILLAALALGASVASLYVHYRLVADPSYTSFCDVSETVSCEAVMTSRYGYLFGIPVAAGGAIWGALVLLLGVFGMKPAPGPAKAGHYDQGSAKAAADKKAGHYEQARSKAPADKSTVDDRPGRVAAYIFVLSTIGLAAVLYLGYASFFVLGQMCPLCLAMYVAVIGLFLVSGAAASDLGGVAGRVGPDLGRMTASGAGLTVALVWAAASIGLLVWFPGEQSVSASAPMAEAVAAPTETLGADEIAQFEAWLASQPRVDLAIASNGARVVVAKFNDYQCPACRQAYIAYKAIQQKYETQHPGQVLFANVDYPLESECNSGGIHSAACEAAVAVRLARTRNRGPEMEAWLFDNQDTLTRDRVKEGLAEIAQVTDFDAQYSTVLELVRADAQLGQKLNITGTPTFFINGIRIASTLRPAYFDAAIEYELKRTSQGS